MCVCWGGRGFQWGKTCTNKWHTHTHRETYMYCKTPTLFTSVHHDGVGLCSQCELIIGRFPLVEVLIEPLLTIIKRLSVDNVHEASE